MDLDKSTEMLGSLQRRKELMPCPTLGRPSPECTNPSHFEFSSLYAIVQNIYRFNNNDGRLWETGLPTTPAQEATLSYDACVQIANTNHGFWTRYPAADVWARLVAWKFPLFQLLATFPRPPSTSTMDTLIVLRLLGNPIGTLYNLILKIASCQAHAAYWKKEFIEPERLYDLVEGATDQEKLKKYTRLWKAFTLIVDSYDEWGLKRGRKARANLRARLLSSRPRLNQIGPPTLSEHQRKDLLDLCEETASSLAADRTTSFLPLVVAQVLFTGSVVFAVVRTISAADYPANYPAIFVNIEIHSIAYSALYLWVISVTLIAAFIGASQTTDSIPRILERFETDLTTYNYQGTVLRHPHQRDSDRHLRDLDGGIYSWQPRKWRTESNWEWVEYIKRDLRGDLHPESANESETTTHEDSELRATASTIPGPKAWWKRMCVGMQDLCTVAPGSALFVILVIGIGTVAGSWISGRVPPTGFSCRHIGQWFIFTVWLLNFGADFLGQP